MIEDEDLHLGLRRGLLGPVGHGSEQVAQRRQQGLAGLLQALAIGLADVLLEQQIEQRQLIVAQTLLRGASAARRRGSPPARRAARRSLRRSPGPSRGCSRR